MCASGGQALPRDGTRTTLAIALAALLAATMVASMSGIGDAAVADTFDDGVFEYAVLTEDVDSGTVSLLRVLDRTAATSPVILPSCDRGGKTYLITEISADAFSGSAITGITIGENVTSIGKNAFKDCVSLSGELSLPHGLTRIDDGAFRGCTGIAGDIAFPAALTHIGDDAFRGCAGITSVSLPCGLKNLSGFGGCVGLESIEIPDNVSEIGDSAFSGCVKLTSLEFPQSLKAIGDKAFHGCTGLKGDLVIPDGVQTIGILAFAGCSGVDDLIIGVCVSSIGDSAFSGLTGLRTMLFLPTSFGAVEMMGDCLSFRNSESDPVLVVSMAGNGFPFGCRNAFTFFDFDCALVTADVSAEGSGTVSGAGIYGIDKTATLLARPALGYEFVRWDDGSTENPKTITAPATKRHVAEIRAKEYVVAYPMVDGFSGSNPTKWNIGMDGTLSDAVPHEGYAFEGWFADAGFNVPVGNIVDAIPVDDEVIKIYAKIVPESYPLILSEGIFTTISVVSGSEGGKTTHKTDLVFKAFPHDGYVDGFNVNVFVGGAYVPPDFVQASGDDVYTLSGDKILGEVEIRTQTVISTNAVQYPEHVSVTERGVPVPSGTMVAVGTKLTVSATAPGGFRPGVVADRGSISSAGVYVMGPYPVTFSAVQTPIDYDVAYVVANGSRGDNPEKWNVGMATGLAPASMNPGYAFHGWYLNPDRTEPFEGFSYRMFEGGRLVVYGKSSVASYGLVETQGEHTTITVVSGGDGGSVTHLTDLRFSVAYDDHYASGATVTAIVGGVGTQLPDADGTIYTLPGESIIGDVELVAEPIPRKHRVSYDVSVAKVTRDGRTVGDGALVEVGAKLVVAPFDKDGYAAAVHIGDQVVSGEYVMQGADVEFTVIRTPIEFAINYFVQNGSKGDNPDMWDVEMGPDLGPAAVNPGYAFHGWYLDPAFSIPFPGFSLGAMADGGMDVYAKTAPGKYGLTVSGYARAGVELVSGGDGGFATHGVDVVFDVIPNSEIPDPFEVIVLVDGMKVDGKTTGEGNRFTFAGDAITGDVAVHVVNKAKYSVEFGEGIVVSAGGAEISSGDKILSGTVLTVEATPKPHYNVFVTADVGEISEIGEYVLLASVVFSVSEVPIEYTVTYVVPEDIDPIPPSTYTVGTSPQLPEMSKEGHTFDGWFLDEGFETPVGKPDPEEPMGDITVYAKFTIHTFEVTWEWIGEGGVLMTETQTLDYGTMPTRDDPDDYVDSEGAEFLFKGWDPELSEITADVTYVAQYEMVPKPSTMGVGAYAAIAVAILGAAAVAVYLAFFRK
ncbi:MAG: leucine-rich repeat protein [Thermoplasmatales archaeon]|nr:leucine-rich repeat protein [Thermoplasmatales archaeon]